VGACEIKPFSRNKNGVFAKNGQDNPTIGGQLLIQNPYKIPKFLKFQ